MADDKTGDGDTKVHTVEELGEQIQNLNKGIAKYRDDATKATEEAKSARAEAAAAKVEAAQVRAAIEEAKDEEVPKEAKLNPEDQKKLEAWAKSQGFVTKEDMDKEQNRLMADSLRNTENQAIDEFVKSHPEYEDTAKWEQVKKEFGQYKQPTSLTGYRQILTKIHRELMGDEEATARARARQEQKSRLGLGGGNQKDADGEDLTLERLQERYPNLSVDQIESRLTEINQLTAARAKRVAERKK